jgi:hypothetical protein
VKSDARPVIFPRIAGAVRLGSALPAFLISVTLMAHECPLSAPLTIRDTQSGFAGETGTVWTIAPDCSYTVARRIGPHTLEPHTRGRLTPEQQAQLKELLGRVAAAALPKELGVSSQMNARRISLSHDGKESILTLAPGAGDLRAVRATAADHATRALLDLADEVKGLTAG